MKNTKNSSDLPAGHQILPGGHQILPGGHQGVPGGHQNSIPGLQDGSEYHQQYPADQASISQGN